MGRVGAEMPFADEACLIAARARQRGEGRVVRRYERIGAARAERFVEADLQTGIVAAGEQRRARRRTDRRVCVTLRHAYAVTRQTVQYGRLDHARAVAAEIGVAEI